MRTISLEQLQSRLAEVDGVPRVVVSGNVATPWTVVDTIDRSIEQYRLYMLNADVGGTRTTGVIAETSFVGPGMRRHPALSYVPSRLSMVPVLFARSMPPDVVVVHCAPPREGFC